MLAKPSIVARTTLIGVLEPNDLLVTSATPASSITARTAPPAATPEPASAGLSKNTTTAVLTENFVRKCCSDHWNFN